MVKVFHKKKEHSFDVNSTSISMLWCEDILCKIYEGSAEVYDILFSIKEKDNYDVIKLLSPINFYRVLQSLRLWTSCNAIWFLKVDNIVFLIKTIPCTKDVVLTSFELCSSDRRWKNASCTPSNVRIQQYNNIKTIML